MPNRKRSTVPRADQRATPRLPRVPGAPRGGRADRLESLEDLHVRADARATGRESSLGWASHAAVLDRLAANVRLAEARGWTSCAIERAGGAGRFCAWGVPPDSAQRHPVPDWSTEAGDAGHRARR